MNTGIPEKCHPVRVNGIPFNLGADINVKLKGSLRIETDYSEGGHICFLRPTLKIKIEPALLM